MKSKAFVVFTAVLMAATAGNIVLAQLRFSDGSEQSTAFMGRSAVPVGKAFAENVVLATGWPVPEPVGGTVPAGEELVILQVSTHFVSSLNFADSLNFAVSSRLPDLSDGIVLTRVGIGM